MVIVHKVIVLRALTVIARIVVTVRTVIVRSVPMVIVRRAIVRIAATDRTVVTVLPQVRELLPAVATIAVDTVMIVVVTATIVARLRGAWIDLRVRLVRRSQMMSPVLS
jgi:hypothetical protein